MILALRAHPASISAAALKHDDPLRILRVLNHVPSWSQCFITVRKPDSNIARITFTFRGPSDWSPNMLPCLDGVVPEIFDCDQLMFGYEGSVYRLNEPRRALDKSHNSLNLPLAIATPSTALADTDLVLVNYRRPFILPDFTSIETVVEGLRTNTLMLCGSPTLGERTVTLSILAEKPRMIARIGFNKLRRQQLETAGAPFQTFTHDLDSEAMVINLLLWVGANASAESRFQIYTGAVPVTPADATRIQSLFAPLRAPLDSQTKRYIGIAAELTAPISRLDYDLDHSLVPDTGYRRMVELLREWVRTVADSSEVRHLLATAREYRDIRVADGLQIRQMRLRGRRTVCYRGKSLLQEPQSEKDVLALYFKLEGANALPFAHCCILEHTPARGTDAIGHFRVSPADALHQYALIEFEYKFANFVAHGHSVRHVDLVICWTASTPSIIRATKHPWLMVYSASDVSKSIPVLVLHGIPGLEVKSD